MECVDVTACKLASSGSGTGYVCNAGQTCISAGCIVHMLHSAIDWCEHLQPCKALHLDDDGDEYYNHQN